MPTDWIRQHVKPSLIHKYEKEMAKLRGETSNKDHVTENLIKLLHEVDQIETDEERRAKELEEDARMEEYLKKNK